MMGCYIIICIVSIMILAYSILCMKSKKFMKFKPFNIFSTKILRVILLISAITYVIFFFNIFSTDDDNNTNENINDAITSIDSSNSKDTIVNENDVQSTYVITEDYSVDAENHTNIITPDVEINENESITDNIKKDDEVKTDTSINVEKDVLNEFSTESILPYSGNPYCVINGNTPFFKNSELTTKSYEKYSSLDSLKRCGVAIACVGKDLMPSEERGSISSIYPTGWIQKQYKGIDAGRLAI